MRIGVGLLIGSTMLSRPHGGSGGGTPTPTPAPVGFYLNGSTNLALKSAISAVQGGTGRKKIVFKGDSTTVGQGGGTGASFYLANTRITRPPAILASLLSSAGIAALDNGVVGDNGMIVASSFPLPSYDPRVVVTSPVWTIGNQITFPGGGFLSSNTGSFRFTPDNTVDTFEVVIFNSNTFTLTFLIDGATPTSFQVIGSSTGQSTSTGNVATVTAAGTGFSKVIIKASSSGTHMLSITGNNTLGAVRSINAYDSAVSAFDLLVHASLGATTANQAASNSSWLNNDALGYDSPDLTVITLGLNDMNAAVSTASYTASLQTIITKAKISGDVLLVFPHPATGAYNSNVANYRVAAANLASSNGIAYLDLWEYFGGIVPTPNRDGVHLEAARYAEIGQVEYQAIRVMAGL